MTRGRVLSRFQSPIPVLNIVMHYMKEPIHESRDSDWRDTGKEGIGMEGFRTGGIQAKRDT